MEKEISSNNLYQIDNLIQSLENSKDNEYLKTFDININLLRDLINDMPKDLTKIEKTIYVYLKMCTLLTYDEEYFAMDQNLEANIKHNNIKNLINIDSNNNQIVCYEFNMIFAKVLDMFDCSVKIIVDEKDGQIFGNGHASLKYNCDGFTVTADSVTSILYGDLQLVKRHVKPIGLVCENDSRDEKEEFSDIVEDMLNIVNSQRDKRINKFNENLEIYHSLVKDRQGLPKIDERMEMLLTSLFKANLKGIDAIGYVRVLARNLFSDIKNNIDMTILNKSMNNKLKPIVIFTMNNDDINEKENNLYLCFEPPNGLEQYDFVEMENLLNHGVYIIRNKPLPGFDIESVNKGYVK